MKVWQVSNLLFGVYLDPSDLGADGYPRQWSSKQWWIRTFGGEEFLSFGPVDMDDERWRIPDYSPHVNHRVVECVEIPAIKDHVRALASHRCVRCHHPYHDPGVLGLSGRWSPCDALCAHDGPTRAAESGGTEAEWRVLTVHHLNGVKADCRWWNLVALCQRCHLSVQARVVMERPFLLEHSDWFKPYVAGFYAWRYLGEELTRQEVEARLHELLALEHRQTTIEDA